MVRRNALAAVAVTAPGRDHNMNSLKAAARAEMSQYGTRFLLWYGHTLGRIGLEKGTDLELPEVGLKVEGMLLLVRCTLRIQSRTAV
jgi:hypothetical protein